MPQPLASVADAADFGLTVTEAAIRRASARIRGHVRQQITQGTSTIKARGPVFRLPERPVESVLSVTDADGNAVGFDLAGSVLTVQSLDVVTVTYSHGYVLVPDELIELVCSVAARIEAVPASSPLAQGVQQQTSGPFTVGYGWDSYKAQSGLTAGEKEVLDRYWPRLPQIIVTGRP